MSFGDARLVHSGDILLRIEFSRGRGIHVLVYALWSVTGTVDKSGMCHVSIDAVLCISSDFSPALLPRHTTEERSQLGGARAKGGGSGIFHRDVAQKMMGRRNLLPVCV